MHAASCSLHTGGGLELRRALEASSPQSPTASLNFFTASSCHLDVTVRLARFLPAWVGEEGGVGGGKGVPLAIPWSSGSATQTGGPGFDSDWCLRWPRRHPTPSGMTRWLTVPTTWVWYQNRPCLLRLGPRWWYCQSQRLFPWPLRLLCRQAWACESRSRRRSNHPWLTQKRLVNLRTG